MYSLTVKNSSSVPLQTSTGETIAPGATWSKQKLGNVTVGSDMYGTLLFVDVGDKRIPGDPGGTWGVLIRYHDTTVVGRYEGGGDINVELNQYLQATIGGKNITLHQVAMPNIII